MATKYRRVTYSDRCQIQAYLQIEFSIAIISKRMGFHKATIYRELERNKNRCKYEAQRAHCKANKRFLRCRRRRKIVGDIEGLILWKLFEDWSPKQISERIRQELEQVVSHETIYRYVRRKKAGLIFCLRRFNKRGFARFTNGKRMVRGLGIRSRPTIANERKRIGDWERDCLFVGKRKKILVCTDRRSRYTKIEKLHEATAKGVSKATARLLKSTGKKMRKGVRRILDSSATR
jgi:IS30 family transposase